jgi:DNA polymerase-4
LAKVASQVAKPDGLLLVPPDRELQFLHPLSVRRLWGVGAVTAERLHAHGLETVADVAQLGESMLASLVGRAMGHRLYALAHNVDFRRVQTGVRRRSMGAQHALGRRRRSPDELDATVMVLVDQITRRMRVAGWVGRTVVLRLRFDDFGRATRSHTLAWPTSSTEPVLAAARGLLASAASLIARRGVTLIGVTVTNIDRGGAQQLELPFDGEPRGLVLDRAVDDVHRRYGASALTRAALLSRDLAPELPRLPD